MAAEGLMPAHAPTVRVLEFGRLLDHLAGFAQTAMGAQLLRQRAPSTQRERIELWHREVVEAVTSGAARGHAALGSAETLDTILATVAAKGRVLEPSDLLRVAKVVRVAAELRKHLESAGDRWPLLAAYADEVPQLGRLAAQIEQLFTPEGEIRDDASPELARVRQHKRRLNADVRRRLERLVHDDRVRDVLQDALVTERGGRFVVPVRADQRDRLKGIVHDTSATRQTLYVEPLEFVDDQNRLTELSGRERSEIVRLLTEVSGHVRAARDSLALAQRTIAAIDQLQALARYARAAAAVAPTFVESGINLQRAVHPLAEREQFVPLDLDIDPELSAVVITGPNTGGKTVALKTLGLFALMAQSGIPVPADEAHLPVFPRLYADIGDEQSLSANLSTFSAHMAHVVEFLGDCPTGSLVLLDELGTGTDPAEGAALGIALVERFVDQGGLVLLSTHHDALKSFAHQHERAVNAAMEFDAATLAPIYRIRIGRPGRSNALDIALGLGLDAELVDRARSLLQTDSVQLDDVIRRLEMDSDAAQAEKLDLEGARAQIEQLKHGYAKAEGRRQAAWAELEREARVAISEAVQRLRREGADKLTQLESAQPAASERSRSDRQASWSSVAGGLEGKSMRRLRERMGRQRRVRDQAAPAVSGSTATPTSAGKSGSAAAATPEAFGALRRGDSVSVAPFGLAGRVMRDWGVDDDPAALEIDVGGKRLIARRDQLQPSKGKPGARSGAGRGGGTRYQRRYDIKSEIDLHGMTVERALTVVDKYLDDAILAELPTVRLIHGYGGLRLRDAIHALLKKRKGVDEFGAAGPTDGGIGVTVVTLES